MKTVSLLLICLGLVGRAHAAGDLIAYYPRPDSSTVFVTATLCEGGTCTNKTLRAMDGTPLTEGSTAAGDTVRFRFSLSSAGPQRTHLYIKRESVFNRLVSPDLYPVLIETQQRADTLLAFVNADTTLIRWALPIPGSSPLGTVVAYRYGAFESGPVYVRTQSAVQWKYRERLCELFGYYGMAGERRTCE